MAVLNLSDFRNSKYTLNEINEFLKNTENLKYMKEVDGVFINMRY